MFGFRYRILNMDVTASPTSSKTQTFLEGQDASEHKDLISRLPDDILVSVLLLIPTEEAVRTSILSRRWRYVWLSIPNLIFSDSKWLRYRTNSHDQLQEIRESFFESIERALVLRKGSCLRGLSLFLSRQICASQLNSWLSAAVKHKVQKLSLFLPMEGDFVLPDSLFTSISLSDFWLKMYCTLKVPSFIRFPGLKCLTLSDVVFQDNHSAQQLFSGCPILERLSLKDCGWKSISRITIEIPTLKSFTLSDHRFLENYLPIRTIMISAMNLEILSVSTPLAVEVLQCLPSLKSASIDIWNHGGRKHSRYIVKLLSELQNVKFLKVSRQTLEPLFLAENLQMHLPTFHNLTHLHAFVESPFYLNGYTSGALVYILRKSPNLECLDLPKVFRPQDQYMILGTVLTCFQSSLKQFIIHDFDGDADGLCLLKYVYKKAPILDRLVIYCSPKLSKDLKKQEKISHQLRQLGEASASCKIVFSPGSYGNYEGLWCKGHT